MRSNLLSLLLEDKIRSMYVLSVSFLYDDTNGSVESTNCVFQWLLLIDFYSNKSLLCVLISNLLNVFESDERFY